MLYKLGTVRLVVDSSKALRRKGQGTEMDIHVVPGASRSEFGAYDQWRKRFQVKVKEPPEDGRANQEVERLVGETFRCKALIVRGQTVRDKTLFLEIDLVNVRQILEARA
jgi:uncharacterized protein (TIGR00251 family)